MLLVNKVTVIVNCGWGWLIGLVVRVWPGELVSGCLAPGAGGVLCRGAGGSWSLSLAAGKLANCEASGQIALAKVWWVLLI